MLNLSSKFSLSPILFFPLYKLITVLFIFQLSKIIKSYFWECKFQHSIQVVDIFYHRSRSFVSKFLSNSNSSLSLVSEFFFEFDFETPLPSCHMNLNLKLFSDHLFERESGNEASNLILNKHWETKFKSELENEALNQIVEK